MFRGTTSTVSLAGAPISRGTGPGATDQPSAGTYYYAVRACNAVGCGPAATTGPVTLSPPPVPAAITSASCSGAKCTFRGTGTGTLRWTFGNGTQGTGSPVSVTYKQVGSYIVTLSDTRSSLPSANRTVTCSLVKKAVRCTT